MSASITIPADEINLLRRYLKKKHTASYYKGVLTIYRSEDGSEEVTQEELDAAFSEYDPELEKKRNGLKSRTKDIFNSSISSGYTHNGNIYSIDSESQENWKGLSVSIRNEIDSGITSLNDNEGVHDINGNLVVMVVSDLLVFLAGLGKYTRNIIQRDIHWKNRIESATSMSELNTVESEMNAL